MEKLFEGKRGLTEETRKGEDVNIVVKYSGMKSETDLKYELAKHKNKIRASRQNIFIVRKGNELI
jgi:hypothetical protein